MARKVAVNLPVVLYIDITMHESTSVIGHEEEDIKDFLCMDASKSLTTLDLAGRHLRELPRDISRLVVIEKLGLANNALTALPNEIGRLSCLRYLNLRANKLREFPPVMQLERLELLVTATNCRTCHETGSRAFQQNLT